MHTSRYFIFALILTLLFASAAVYAQDKPIEQFSASIISMGGSTKAPTPITIRIFRYTPEEEVAKLRSLLESKGSDAVADAIWNERMGHISPVGGVGMDINYVRSINTSEGKIIRMATARVIPFWELRSSRPSVDYPFNIMELVILNNGKIQGSVIARAKVQFNKDHGLEIKSYGSDRLRLVNIRKQ